MTLGPILRGRTPPLCRKCSSGSANCHTDHSRPPHAHHFRVAEGVGERPYARHLHKRPLLAERLSRPGPLLKVPLTPSTLGPESAGTPPTTTKRAGDRHVRAAAGTCPMVGALLLQLSAANTATEAAPGRDVPRVPDFYKDRDGWDKYRRRRLFHKYGERHASARRRCAAG